MQPRLGALSQQVELRYGRHEPSLKKRVAAIDAATAAWDRVEQERAQAGGRLDRAALARNQQRLAAWVDRAMNAAMAGGSGRLPKPPRFETVIGPPPATRPAPEPPAERLAPPQALTEISRTSERKTTQQLPAVPAPERRRAAKPIAPVERPEPTPAAPKRSKWSRHPAAAPLEWADPFEDDAEASSDPLGASATTREALRPIFDDRSPVTVNLAQLAAEVRGYSLAVRQLQIDVMALDADDLVGLMKAADRLDELLEKRQFLDLYRDGLADADRRALPGAPSAELVRELVRRKAETLLRATPADRLKERGALQRLAERLAPSSVADAAKY